MDKLPADRLQGFRRASRRPQKQLPARGWRGVIVASGVAHLTRSFRLQPAEAEKSKQS